MKSSPARTQDANLAIIGKKCDALGIRLTETRVIADVEADIIKTVNDCRAAFTYVFTTGGIGPTHDDITAAAVGKAFNVEVMRNEEAVNAMDRYYEPGFLTEARLKMADIPEGARLIDNPVSAAPGFQLENVFVLPGVPSIMEAMFDGPVRQAGGGRPHSYCKRRLQSSRKRNSKRPGRLAGQLSGRQYGKLPVFQERETGCEPGAAQHG